MTCSFSQAGGRPPCESTIGWSVRLFQDVWSVPSGYEHLHKHLCVDTHSSPLEESLGGLLYVAPGATVAKGHKTIEMYSQGPDVQDPGAGGAGLFLRVTRESELDVSP